MFLRVLVTAVIFRRHGWRDSLEEYRFIDLCLPLQMLASYTAFGYSPRSHSCINLLVTFRFYFLFTERKVKFNRKNVSVWSFVLKSFNVLDLIGSAFLNKFYHRLSHKGARSWNTWVYFLSLQPDDICITSPHFCLCQLTALITFSD
jgi:hypothetical protein